MGRLTHLNEEGHAHMVNVGDKEETNRQGIARGKILMKPATLALIQEGNMPKGDVLAVARLAGIMAAKQTAQLIPLCHPLMLTGSEVDFRFNQGESSVEVQAVVSTSGKTGVEMEALTAVSVALLTIYDMCKAVDKEMKIEQIRLVKKTGGKSGDYIGKGEEPWEK